MKMIARACTVLALLATTVQAAPKAAGTEDVKKVTAAMPKTAPAKPAQARKVLVFCRCEGFPHGSIPVANACFEIMGKATGAFEATVSDDMAVFTAENLKQYDAILFNNTTQLAFKDPAQRKALMDFVRGGKGVVGVHAATDNFPTWPEAVEMMGGVFSGHPWNAGGTWAVKLDEPGHPLMASFDGKGFKIRDEIYKYKAGSFSRAKVRVLASLDFADAATAKHRNPRNADEADVAISWVRPFGQGRVFFCSLGHNNEVFWNKAVLAHYLAGIQYALGDLKVPDAPAPAATTTSRPAVSSSPPSASAPAAAPLRDPCVPVEDLGCLPHEGDQADATPYPLIGDWRGESSRGTEEVAAQVIPMGKGAYQVHLLRKFLSAGDPENVVPGREVEAGKKIDLTGKIKDGKVAIQGEVTPAKIAMKIVGGDEPVTLELTRVVRLSPTLGAKAPAGAVVLLGKDTKDLNTEWVRHGGKACGWKLLPGGVAQVAPNSGSIITKKRFGDQRLHVEFRTPLEPEKRGQGRGNSGVYLQGLYEVQVLDSYGLRARNNECGGIYGVAAPRVNMCAPPGQWQTYDITFQAAVLKDGKVVSPARITVLHNGVKVHDSVTLPGTTTAAPSGAISQTGGLYLQDHGNAVEYRNIWVVETPAGGKE